MTKSGRRHSLGQKDSKDSGPAGVMNAQNFETILSVGAYQQSFAIAMILLTSAPEIPVLRPSTSASTIL